jgi:predicted acetyltransferase
LTEIRPIRREEANDFLHLLCEAFDLDFERAKGVFFSEPMFDLDRKWAYFRDRKMQSILTTVPLRFGWGRAIGIAGVATRLASRGQGMGGELLKEVLRAAKAKEEGAALLFAKDRTLYERIGFRLLDEVVKAPLRTSFGGSLEAVMPIEEVMAVYARWASENPNRLHRDEQRWTYWKWNMRFCCPFSNGYLCLEGATLRECIVDAEAYSWPLHDGTDWVGLRSVAQECHAPIEGGAVELYLMGVGFEETPQMFMTDQF